MTLRSFEAVALAGEVELRWATDPAPGPTGLAGYRLERLAADGAATTLADSITATSWRGPEHERGVRYRLSALDGLGRRLELGEASIATLADVFRLWPQPARGGRFTLELAAPALADGLTPPDFAIEAFDVVGRRVATLARGRIPTALGLVRFDHSNRSGESWPSGLYFVRAQSPSLGWVRKRRLWVLESP